MRPGQRPSQRTPAAVRQGEGPGLGNAGHQIVQDYAEKRRQQLERAREIREERDRVRKAQGDSAPPAAAGPPHGGQPASARLDARLRQQQLGEALPHVTPRDAPAPAAPAGMSLSNSIGAGGGYAGMASASARQMAAAPVAAPQPPAASGDALVVSESDLQAAVAAGVITGHQSRQLWDVLRRTAPPASARPGSGRRHSRDRHVSSPQLQQQPQPQPQQQQQQQQQQPAYSHQHYAEDAGAPQRMGSSGRIRQPQRQGSGRRPEWDADWTGTGGADDPQLGASARGAPPPEQGEGASPAPKQRKVSGRNLTRRPGAPAAASAAAPNSGRPEWVGFGAEDAGGGDGTFGSPPPVRGAPGGATRRSAQPERVGSAQQLRSSQQLAAAPPQRGGSFGGGGVVQLEEAPAVAAGAPEQDWERIAAEAASEPQEVCKICERSFRVSVLRRHEKTCGQQRQRRVFNTAKQRVDAQPQEYQRQALKVAKEVKKETVHRAEPTATEEMSSAAKASKWKAQSEQFQAAMRAARTVQQVEAGQLPASALASLPQPADDRTPCPHCGRKFAAEVAERHIPKCKIMQLNKRPPPQTRRR
eukprot:TRINITY_DN6504_c0_g2_i1.p1 TRINITY_DN6504_c0_g2~~TRINITY_DN6504_c0_g2_i1.p1  ORF type:complete len:618 (+),score=145.35 TRINITY_DN6504_c0_g2_i1:96-1856(+)